MRRTTALVALALSLGCARDADPLRVAVPQGLLPLVTDLVFQHRARDPRARIDVRAVPTATDALDSLRTATFHAAVVVAQPRSSQDAELIEYVIARLPLVFGVHEGVAVPALTREQICDLYSGRIANWRALGGADVPVRAGVRPPVAGDRGNPLALLSCGPEFRFAPGVQMIEGAADIALSAIAVTPGAIGMAPPDVFTARGEQVRLLSVDGVPPTPENVARGTYPLARQIVLLTRDPLPPRAARFLAFAHSPPGARIIQAAGAVPAAPSPVPR